MVQSIDYSKNRGFIILKALELPGEGLSRSVVGGRGLQWMSHLNRGLQQYVNQNQQYYYKIPLTMNSFQDSSETESQKAGTSSLSLNTVKPWVFRPKKVIYSLDAGATTAHKQFSTSHWNEEENDKYVTFLTKFKSVIEGGKKNRRKWHLNRMMSKAIITRSHEQCRSHHQKMMKHYSTIDGILEHLTRAPAESCSSTLQADQISENRCPSGQVAPLQNPFQINWSWDCLEHSVQVQLPFYFEEEPLI